MAPSRDRSREFNISNIRALGTNQPSTIGVNGWFFCALIHWRSAGITTNFGAVLQPVKISIKLSINCISIAALNDLCIFNFGLLVFELRIILADEPPFDEPQDLVDDSVE